MARSTPGRIETALAFIPEWMKGRAASIKFVNALAEKIDRW
jgi:hypothetical protein